MIKLSDPKLDTLLFYLLTSLRFLKNIVLNLTFQESKILIYLLEQGERNLNSIRTSVIYPIKTNRTTVYVV